MSETTSLRKPLVEPQKPLSAVNDDIIRHMERKPGRGWWLTFGVAFGAFLLGLWATVHLIRVGIGAWGLNKTVGWAFDITNFVFWIGIGHAGTFISAILFLFRQKWRTAINRSAEAMTLFAVTCAGVFPLIHMGRIWFFYWMLPYPNDRGALWVNFRSPLVWDFFAISTYFLISLVFWYLGLVPDLAAVRDRVKGKVRRFIFRFFSHGWNGSQRSWSRYEAVYAMMAGLATPLVLSVHSIVSMDFAAALIPGWHTTIFPPYFVSGAIFSGFAMVITLMTLARKFMRLENYITVRHFENMAKVIIITGGIVALAYLTELFTAWYSGNLYEKYAFANRAFGPYWWGYFIMVGCNVLIPQLFWFKKIRTTIWMLFVISIFINIGMWFERFVIVVTSLHRDFLPSSWAMYTPTFIEVAILIGSFGLFFSLFLVFIRVLPVVSISEVKGVLKYGRNGGHNKK